MTAEAAPSAATPAVSPDVPLVDIRHLVKEFPVTAGAVLQRKIGSVKAVTDVSFTIAKRETFGLVGESGCGKTTIGRMLVGLDKPTGGEIRFEGRDISRMHGSQLRRQRRDLQLVFQDPYASLDPRMRVGTIVKEPLVVQRIGKPEERNARVRQLLGEVGLSAKAIDLYPHEFSGGQRQRIGLARALTLNPKLIVADEPVSALDVSIRSQILNLMNQLQETHGLTYLVISHDLSVVKYLSDRIGVMYLGRLVEVGAAHDVYASPAHPYTLGLIHAIPEPDPRRERAKEVAPIRGELPSAMNPPSGCRFRTRCPRAQALCAEATPPMRAFGPGHFAACHFPLQNPLPEAATPETPAAA